jgi:predicted DNA-binding transcriptional regulator YafY
MVEGSMLKAIAFTMEEALALIYGIKLLEQQKGVIKAPGQVKEKLLALLPKKLSNEIESIGQQVEIEVAPAADYSGKESLFKEINEAIKNHTLLRMKYYSFSRDEVTDRIIEPYQLVFKDGFWYLVAFCHRNQETRLFRIDRIRGLESTTQTFSPPVDYSYEEYMGAAWQMERGEEFSFKVRFFSRAARFVRETNFHPSQEIIEEPGGTIVFIAKACGHRSVLRWVLSFGDEAEVLEPPELRAMMAKTMAAGLERYSKTNRGGEK